ncbi:DapH/DapD/GlmU-related protein [Gordonia sp. (in: high G+C Gram-positive bacteria)]|uniref:DapH/DapD/GlmU-related protein n=1 Tax=Gordonia sp. (in: high G+C Gram-positive bacteria) TaxID=84139 RepID=UPI00257EC422|nr:DapH/DapD/GlmU-related protein [Gordonia sp. (in: high G+C Gram-positive bacteria)]
MSAIDRYLRCLFERAGTTLVEYEAEFDSESRIGVNSWIRMGSYLEDAVVGDDVFVGFRTRLKNCEIGDSTLVASGARIGSADGARTRIGSGVWIGAGAHIAAGVTIANGAVVAAGSLVVDSVAAFSIVAGRPARYLRERTVEHDGLPSFQELLQTVVRRQRGPYLLTCVLARAAASHEHAAAAIASVIAEYEPVASTWRIGAPALVDADLFGGSDVALSDNAILIGRGRRSSGQWPIGGIELGVGTVIGNGALLEGAGGITAGTGVTIGPGSAVLSSGHDHRRTSLPLTPAPVQIGDGVQVGRDAVIVGPIEIPTNEIIPAGAIVRRSSQDPGGISITATRYDTRSEGAFS